MLKVLYITTFLLFCLQPTSFGKTTSDSIQINIAVLDTARAIKVSLIVEIKNLSNETKNILKHGRVDYVNGKTKPVGNYIIEVERLQMEKFVPFPPTADIDPVFEKDHWEIKPNGYLMETLNLNGQSWSSKGFPKGQYRARVGFNWDEWGSSVKNISRWVKFTID